MMTDMLLIEESIEVPVSPGFAWKHRTDVANWSDPSATFTLDGPFAAGTLGRTVMPGQPALVWSIGDVQPGRSFTIEMALDRATLQFEWLFDAVAGGATKVTQRIILSGANASTYKDQVENTFSSSFTEGMKRIAAQMVAANCARRTDS